MFEQATGNAAVVEDEDFGVFTEGVGPLLESGKLGVLLAQFPTSFRPDPARLEYLEDADPPAARRGLSAGHRAAPPRVDGIRPGARRCARLMEQEKVAWVMIDEPRFKTSIRHVPLTSDLGYFRFHGRNYAQWWKHGESEDRYNYLYTPAEQKELAEDVREVANQTQETYAFYNNHYGAKAVVNALQLQTMLDMPPPQESLPEVLQQSFPDVLQEVAKPG